MAAARVIIQLQADAFLRNLDQLRERFGKPLQNALRESHTEMAITIQEGMAKHLRREVEATGRPQVDRPDHRAGALGLSLLAEQNRRVEWGKFSVGRLDYLNNDSPARRYWRQIDEGGPAYSANVLFFDPGGPWGPNPAMFRMHGRAPQVASRSRSGLGAITIGPFPAYRFSDAAISTFDRINKYGVYERFLANVGIPLSKDMRN